MLPLNIGYEYTREQVHGIFAPETNFTPQAGTWGLQGIVRVPARHGDWVFFVTFGKQQGDHVFDESITEDGVLSWQSQPAQDLDHPTVHEWINHDDRVNSIHLFLRTADRAPYTYLGTLGYLTHDRSRSEPVYFQWQLMDWPLPAGVVEKMGLQLLKAPSPTTDVPAVTAEERPSIHYVPAPRSPRNRAGVSTEEFRQRKAPDYAARDAKNRALGLAGEILVLEIERERLQAAGRPDLASKVTHVATVEGDAAGYDIRSFATDGQPRYIEVKTTMGGAETGFFLSSNEVAFATKNAPRYELHRLFLFDQEKKNAAAYVLVGDLTSALVLEPILYRGKLRD